MKALLQWWVFLHTKETKMTHCIKCKKIIVGNFYHVVIKGGVIRGHTWVICERCDIRQNEKGEPVPHLSMGH